VEEALMARAQAVLVLFSALALASLAPQAGRAQASTSTSENPTFAFTTPGLKQISLKACNAQGCSTVTRMVTVLDPTPVILSALVGATAVEAGQQVNLLGTGRGQPPLTYTWRMTSLTNPEIDVTGAGAWWDTTGVAPGLYSVALHLQNGIGGVDSLPTVVAVVAPTAQSFYTITPCRLLDTRNTNPLTSGTQITFPAAGLNAFACGIPVGAKALSVNVTVVSPTALGFVSLFPGNYPVPPVSTINFSAGQTRTNNAIVPLSSDGSGNLAALSSVVGKGNVQLVLDVNGYFM
jgi:PKD repeat protein